MKSSFTKLQIDEPMGDNYRKVRTVSEIFLVLCRGIFNEKVFHS